MAWYIPTTWFEKTGQFTRTTPYEYSKLGNGLYEVKASYRTKHLGAFFGAPRVNFPLRVQGSTKKRAKQRWIRHARHLMYN